MAACKALLETVLVESKQWLPVGLREVIHLGLTLGHYLPCPGVLKETELSWRNSKRPLQPTHSYKVNQVYYGEGETANPDATRGSISDGPKAQQSRNTAGL